MESVVTRARHFQFKPDGDVTFMMAQDAVGLPAPVMQACLCHITLPGTLDAHLQKCPVACPCLAHHILPQYVDRFSPHSVAGLPA